MVLIWPVLAVSAVSVLLQGTAACHHNRLQHRAVSGAQQVAGRGYARSAGLHGLVACAYLTAASLQAAGIRQPLSSESLVLFAATQLTGLGSTGLDVLLHHRLARITGTADAGA